MLFMHVCEQKREYKRQDKCACVCVCVCDSDSNCSSPLLQKLLAWSALSQSECPHKKASQWAKESRGKTVSQLTGLPSHCLCHTVLSAVVHHLTLTKLSDKKWSLSMDVGFLFFALASLWGAWKLIGFIVDFLLPSVFLYSPHSSLSISPSFYFHSTHFICIDKYVSQFGE